MPIFAAALLAVACSEGQGVRSDVPDLLRSIPSRSIVVMHLKDCEPALEKLLDSTSAFRAIDYGHFAKAEAILSYDYGAKLIPLLSINTGKVADTVGDVSSIISQAARLKLHSRFSRDTVEGRSVLFISPSEAALGEVDNHLSARTSILEAPGFTEALAKGSGSAGTVYLRNDAASRWLPDDFLLKYIPRRKMVDFFTRACEWTVAALSSGMLDDMQISEEGEGDRYFMNVFDAVEAGESRLSKVLPDSADFVVDLPLKSWKGYYDARVRYLDARAVLDKHKRALRTLKGTFGKDPLAWAAELDLKEVALASFDGHSVLLLRPAKGKNLPRESGGFAYPGFAAELFGGVFAPGDESSCAGVQGWLAVGGAEDIEAFAVRQGGVFGDFPAKDLKFAVLADGRLLCGTSAGISIKNKK